MRSWTGEDTSRVRIELELISSVAKLLEDDCDGCLLKRASGLVGVADSSVGGEGSGADVGSCTGTLEDQPLRVAANTPIECERTGHKRWQTIANLSYNGCHSSRSTIDEIRL